MVFLFTFLISLNSNLGNAEVDYTIYHQKVLEAEQQITNEDFEKAYAIFREIISEYDFVFLREYKVITQLAVYLKDYDSAFTFLQSGIKAGWTLKSIEKTTFLSSLKELERWNDIKAAYPDLREGYLGSLNKSIQDEVHLMFKQDQRKAFRAFLKITSKGQDRFAEKRYAPDSELRMRRIDEIIEAYGYPGESLIGNGIWISTLLSHHNSISQRYNERDTLYPNLRPKLLRSIQRGELSPYDFAFLDEWYILVKSDRKNAGYGLIGELTRDNQHEIVERRKSLGIRPLETRNKLIDIEGQTGMNFYLLGHPWQDGKIEVPE